MSKFWKWFLGIALALVVASAVVMVGFMAKAHMGFARHAPMFVVGGEPSVGVVEFSRVEGHGPGAKFHGGMQRGGFERRGGHGGGLVHLILFAGLVYGAYWLGRRNARLILDPSMPSAGQRPEPAAPKADASAPAAAAAKPATRTRKKS